MQSIRITRLLSCALVTLTLGLTTLAQAQNEHTPALIDAARQLSTTRAAELIRKGADVDVQDKFGKTPLMHAVLRRNFDMIRLLLRSGAELDIQNNAGQTALIIAAQLPFEWGNTDADRADPGRICHLLISIGADMSICDHNGHNVDWHLEETRKLNEMNCPYEN